MYTSIVMVFAEVLLWCNEGFFYDKCLYLYISPGGVQNEVYEFVIIFF